MSNQDSIRKLLDNAPDLETKLRMIIAFARDGGNEPKDTYVQLILQTLTDALPAERHYTIETVPHYLKPDKSKVETWRDALRHEDGFNQAIKQVKDLLGDDNVRTR